MNERLQEILDATVREYIETGEPVSSLRLYEDYDLGIKPARIRAILNELSDFGFLMQPHISGGRIPSDRALELFVTNVLEDIASMQRAEWHMRAALLRSIERGALAEMVRAVSGELELLGAGYAEKRKDFYASGLDELVEQINFNDKSELHEIIKDFERLEERIENWVSRERESAKKTEVFIGKKSPITKSPHLAVMTGVVGDGEDKALLIAIGPRRMNYEKGLKFFKSIEELLKN